MFLVVAKLSCVFVMARQKHAAINEQNVFGHRICYGKC